MELLRQLHSHLGTITDIKVLDTMPDEHIEAGPTVLSGKLNAIYRAIEAGHVLDLGGHRINMKTRGREIAAFLSAYGKRVSEIGIERMERDAVETHVHLLRMIVRQIVNAGDEAAKRWVIEFHNTDPYDCPAWLFKGENLEGEREYMISTYHEAKHNTLEILTDHWREMLKKYNAEAKEKMQAIYKPIPEKRELINTAYKHAKSELQTQG